MLTRIRDKDKEYGIWNMDLETGSQDKRIRMASIMTYIVHSNVKNVAKIRIREGGFGGRVLKIRRTQEPLNS